MGSCLGIDQNRFQGYFAEESEPQPVPTTFNRVWFDRVGSKLYELTGAGSRAETVKETISWCGHHITGEMSYLMLNIRNKYEYNPE